MPSYGERSPGQQMRRRNARQCQPVDGVDTPSEALRRRPSESDVPEDQQHRQDRLALAVREIDDEVLREIDRDEEPEKYDGELPFGPAGHADSGQNQAGADGRQQGV